MYLRLFLVCIMIAPIFIWGCSGGHQARSLTKEANDFFNQGKYEASLSKYEQIIEKNPAVADRVLFEMGIIYAHPSNEQKDYQKSLKCFQKILR
ncbi:MAG: tetratricopeptide repeat protein, partial [Desulfobacterales bacterium]